MKKLAERLFAVTVLSTALFTACINNEDTPEPNFPASIEEAWVDPNSNYTLHLSPNQEWMVSIPSEASNYWGIRNGAQISNSIGGAAGDVEVVIVCLATEEVLGDYSVEVSMTMGGETRVIAVLSLRSGTPVLRIRSAVIAQESDNPDHKYFQSSSDGDFIYEYETDTVPADGSVPMIWNASRNGYLSYIQVESNFNCSPRSESSAMTITELESPNTDNAYTEYEIFCSDVNLGTEPVGKVFNLVSEMQGYETTPVSMSLPQFVPFIEVRTTVPTEDGLNFEIPAGDDSPYNWLYSEQPLVLAANETGLADADTVDMLWRPYGMIQEVDAYILVRSNFSFTPVSGAEWLSISDNTTVEETSDAYETENYFRIYSAAADVVLEGAESTIKINFGEADDDIYSQMFSVASPDVSDVFYVTTVPTFNFDADGVFQANEMGMTTNATVEITSAAEVVVSEFYIRNGFYWIDEEGEAGWINHTYNWASSAAAIQSVTMTVSVAENTGDAREGLVMAFPPEVWDSILEKANNAGYGEDVAMVLFDQRDGTVILPEYENYAVAYIEQNAPAGAVEPYNPDEGWASTDVGASFGNLDPNDDIYYMEGIGVSYDTPGYEITYTQIASDYEFGADTQFKVNVEYDSYKVFDMNSGILAEDQVSSYWAQYRESESTGTNYIGVAPGSEEGDAYFLLMNGDVCVAIIHIVYDSDAGGSGSLDLEMTQGAPDFTFTEYTEEGVTAPCYLLTYTGTGSGMAAISNFPATGWNFGASDWLTVNPMAGLAMFEVDPSLVTPDDNECRVTFYNESLSGIACIIICRVVTE